MIFEFTPDADFSFIQHFAHHLTVETDGEQLFIPEWLGNGHIRKIDLAPDFGILVHQYRLREELLLKRIAPQAETGAVRILFNIQQPIEEPHRNFSPSKQTEEEFAIRITSDNMVSQMYFPANSDIYFVILGVQLDKLRALLSIKEANSVVETILQGAASYLFYEKMSLSVQHTLQQLTSARMADELSALYCKTRVQELIYLLFTQLLKRHNTQHYPIHPADVEKLFAIKAYLLENLAQPPKLSQLSQLATMSQTKMTALFKQVFGDSIYDYYQKMRMEKAAALLREGSHSVSQVGYQLGFTNLSHFSRIFEKHHGIKPKKYSSGG